MKLLTFLAREYCDREDEEHLLVKLEIVVKCIFCNHQRTKSFLTLDERKTISSAQNSIKMSSDGTCKI